MLTQIRKGKKYNLKSQHLKMASRERYNLFVSFQRGVRRQTSIFWSYVVLCRDYEI
jgi:hypothetical protein